MVKIRHNLCRYRFPILAGVLPKVRVKRFHHLNPRRIRSCQSVTGLGPYHYVLCRAPVGGMNKVNILIANVFSYLNVLTLVGKMNNVYRHVFEKVVLIKGFQMTVDHIAEIRSGYAKLFIARHCQTKWFKTGVRNSACVRYHMLLMTEEFLN